MGQDSDIVGQQTTPACTPEQLLRCAAIAICEQEGIDFKTISAVQRKMITHYRCPTCKLQPLYHLDLRYPTKPKCGRCRDVVSIRATGTKYGRVRKKIWLFISSN